MADFFFLIILLQDNQLPTTLKYVLIDILNLSQPDIIVSF